MAWSKLTLAGVGAIFLPNVVAPWRGGRVPAASSSRISRLLADWSQGNEEAREAFIPVVYDELRRIARRHLWHERPDHTLQSAALVNEAYLRLVRQDPPQWQDRAHFLAVAAQLMRHIRVDHARARLTGKRGGGAPDFPSMRSLSRRRNRNSISSHSTMLSPNSPRLTRSKAA